MLAIVFAISSCNKETHLENSNLDDTWFFPSVKNGTLYFSSQEALKAYYEYIATEIKNAEDYDAILSKKEEELGYSSLRKSLNNSSPSGTRDEEEEFTKEEILAQMETEFISDEIRQSILNSYYEFGIGNDLYVYMSANQMFKIVDSDTYKKNVLRGLPKGNDDEIYALNEIDAKMELLSATKNVGYLNPMDPNTFLGTPPPPEGDLEFRITMTVEHFECESLKKKYTGKFEHKDPERSYWESHEVEAFVFDPGEYNTSSTNVNLTPSGYRNSSFQYTHYYDNYGEYRPGVHVTFRETFASNPQTKYFGWTGGVIPVLNSCTVAENHETDWVDDGAKAMSCKIWYVSDIIGHHAGSYTHGWHWRPSKRKWKRERAFIKTTIDATFREESCEIDDTRNEEDYKTNAKKVRASVVKWGHHHISDDDLTSRHQFTKDGHYFSKDLSLQVCN